MLLAALLLLASQPAQADQSARINPQAVLVKSFDGWGTSLCWWAHVLGGSTNRELYADLAFKQLQINIVRYNIGGGEDPAHPERMQARARIPGFEPQPGVWDWNADANQRWFLHAAVARGANKVVAFVNSPPYWMTVSGSVTGTTNGLENNLRLDHEAAFAEYVTTVLGHLAALDGVNFDYLAVMNEPASDWWKFDGHQEGDHMSAYQQARLINLLPPLLQQNGLHTGIEASEDNAEQQTVNAVGSFPTATKNKLALIASHSYAANAPDELRELAVSLKKPLWMSEYGDGGRDGLTLARRIRDDIAVMHAQAWVYWQFAEPDSDWGLVQYHWGDANPQPIFNRKFYVFSQFSRFIRPGDEIIDASDADSLAAYNASLQRLTIVSVNDRDTVCTKDFDLSAFTAAGSRASVRRTSDHEDFAELPALRIQNNQFTATLPAKSVTTWVIDGMAR